MSAATEQELTDILNSHSTEKYYIEHTGRRSNHLVHGVVALGRLGASTQRILQFLTSYVRRLEKPEKYADENRDVTSSIEELKGEKRAYYVILSHYLDVLKTYGSLQEFTGKEFPKLLPGMLGAAFHGTIQMGYGLAANNERAVCEGFAYLHHSYRPLKVANPDELSKPLGKPGDTDIVSVIEQVRLNQEFNEKVALPVGKVSVTKRAGILLAENGDELLRYVNSIKLPASFDPAQDVNRQKDALLKWVVDSSILVYVMSEARNDFFLLHGVTAAWSLKILLTAVDKAEHITAAVRVFSVHTVGRVRGPGKSKPQA